MITAAQQLSTYGITTADARAWVLANLHDPATIHSVAATFGVTSGMLAEIAGPGITADQVIAFFGSNGINANDLDGGVERVGLFPESVEGLEQQLTPVNTSTGALSTASLRAEILSHTDELSYWALFSPNRLKGAADGVLSPVDLGDDQLASIAATPEAIESLFYGTIIKLLGAVDYQELSEIYAFASAHDAELRAGDATATTDYNLLIGKAFMDAAETSYYSPAAIEAIIIDATVDAAQLVGSGGEIALFGPAFTALI